MANLESDKDTLDGEKFSQILGRGKSGNSIIVQGFHKKSKKQVAIKIISKKNMKMQEIDNTRDQIKMYQITEHHNTVKLEDYFESKERFYLCLELHSQRTLYDHVIKFARYRDEIKARGMSQKIC